MMSLADFMREKKKALGLISDITGYANSLELVAKVDDRFCNSVTAEMKRLQMDLKPIEWAMKEIVYAANRDIEREQYKNGNGNR